MSEQRSVDGSLVFDTKINVESFKQDLEELKGIAEQTEVQAVVGSKIDKTGYEADKQELNREAESGIDTVTGKSDLDKSGFEADKRELDRQAESGIDTVTAPTAVDDSGLKKDISKLDDTAKKAVSQLDSPLKDGELTFDTKVSGTSAAEIAKGMLGSNLIQTGIQKLAEGVKDGIQLASDLEEVQNVVDVTFGEGAGQIEEFAKAASTSFGLTELQAKQFTGTVGAMVKSMGLTEQEALDMSTSLVGLTGDMASFYNLDHETAFEKIRSGISGETEPLKALGINMSVANLEAYRLTKGIKKAYEEMSEAEKVQLRYGYIMEQTTDAQGDFVRTQDSYANQVRVLQNNLDTMAANVGGMLVPALTKAVGWLNDLFAGPGETNATQTAINDAATSLSNMETDIQNLKNNYTTTVLSIEVNYTRSQELLDDLVALQNLPTQSENTAQRMREITEALVGMYPSLKEYVGENGLFSKEASAVKELVTNMRELAKEQAYQSLIAGLQTTYTKGLVDYELIGAQYDKALKDAQNLQGKIDALNQIDTVLMATESRYAGYSMKPEYYQEIIDAINEYVTAFGGLENIDSERINRLGIDLAGLFDGAALRGLDELTAENRIGDLVNLLGVIAKSDLNEETIRGEYTGAQAALESAKTAIEDQADSLLLAAEELETAEKLYEEKFGDGAEPIVDYTAEAQAAIEEQSKKVEATLSKGIADGAATGVSSALVSLNAAQTFAMYANAGTNAGAAYGKAFSSAAKANMGIPYNVSAISYPGHATGLDRVPYDNYLARLHVGEAVLTASEAQRWRAGESKGGGVSAEQLAAAMEPVVESIRNIRIALDVDGREFASNQAAHNRTALNRYNTQIARGMGK